VAVKARGGYRIVDEIYLGLSYGDRRQSVLSVDDDAIVVQSFSKYFAMTGWRLGWLVVPEALVSVMETLSQHLFICPATPTQHAALACFETDSMALYEQRRLELMARRDYLVPALRELGFGVPMLPDGAFYVYADISQFSQNSTTFAHDLLHQAHVAVTPGMDFGIAAPKQHVRLSYASDRESLQTAVMRMAQFLR
jgi:aspartate/methionine/tyrosine aminotransferase